MGCFSISLENNVDFIESVYDDRSIRFFINDADVDEDRYFGACFCGNGKYIYSPFGSVRLIIYDDESVTTCDDDVSNSFGESVLGIAIIFEGNDGHVVEISWQLEERPQGLKK
jgi:hypothetical protein